MAFEYFIDMACPIQSPRSPVEFMRRVKTYHAGVHCESIRQKEAAPDEFLEMEIRMGYPVPTLLGSRECLKMKELFEVRDRIGRKATPHCRDCPASKGELFGCHGAITYPISPAGERWLMQRFKPVNGKHGYIPHHIDANDFSGSSFDESRGEHEPPHSIPLALHDGRAVARLSDGSEYSSSQIFEYLLACQPTLRNVTLIGLCADFGAVQIDEAEIAKLVSISWLESMSGKEILSGARADYKRSKPFLMLPDRSDNRTIAELKQFFHACWTAFLLDRPFRIDG